MIGNCLTDHSNVWQRIWQIRAEGLFFKKKKAKHIILIWRPEFFSDRHCLIELMEACLICPTQPVVSFWVWWKLTCWRDIRDCYKIAKVNLVWVLVALLMYVQSCGLPFLWEKSRSAFVSEVMFPISTVWLTSDFNLSIIYTDENGNYRFEHQG